MNQIVNESMPKSDVYYYDDDEFVCEGYKGPGWYFWDETETGLIGPFQNDSRANTALKVYTNSI